LQRDGSVKKTGKMKIFVLKFDKEIESISLETLTNF